MKKIISLLLFITLISMINVKAANYELKELIPVGIKTTIVTKHFSYRQLYYDQTDNTIHFSSIKNISTEEIPLSISIGLFDSKKRNVGIINYCDENNKISAGNEVSFSIEVISDYLGEKKTKDDIKYITVLEENYTCKTDKSQNYIGQKVDDIGKFYGGEMTESSKLTIQVISVIGAVILIIFLYQFLFTNKFKNIDGNEIREVLKNYKNENSSANTFGVTTNESHSEMPEGISVINKSKTAEMADKEAEENEKSQRKENDLYDMYK